MYRGIITFCLSRVYLSQLAESTRKVNATGLVGKANINTERRVDVSCGAVLLLDSLEVLDILLIERDELAVLVNARWCYGLGKD